MKLKKMPKMRPNSFRYCHYEWITFTVENGSLKICVSFVIFKKTVQSKQSPNTWKFAQSGHTAKHQIIGLNARTDNVWRHKCGCCYFLPSIVNKVLIGDFKHHVYTYVHVYNDVATDKNAKVFKTGRRQCGVMTRFDTPVYSGNQAVMTCLFHLITAKQYIYIQKPKLT
jgi:hypothetical protein